MNGKNYTGKRMTEEKNIRLLRDSWSKCEDIIMSLGMKTEGDLQKKIGKAKWSELFNFLKEIGFVNDISLIEVGKEYYKRKFILRDKELAQKVLSSTLKRFSPTQAICQLLWGRPNLTRLSVYRLLVFEEYINPREVKESELGGFLMLLNRCDILKYSKKTNHITILYNPRATENAKLSTKFLAPKTPYSNIRNLREILRNSTKFIHWFDKHFSAKGLEPLMDEADGNKIKQIKILAGVTSSAINKKLRQDFIRFCEEMKTRQINAKLKIICDKAVLHGIHDRWIISEKLCFNVPPINSIFQGQYSEMKDTKNRPPFDEWWSKGLDIIKDWKEISNHI